MAPWMAQRRLGISVCAPSVWQLNKSLLFGVWRIPFQLPTMHAHAAHTFMPTPVILTWAALSPPQSCFGCSTRDNVSSLWLRGATAPCFFISGHFSAVPCRPGVPVTLVSSNPP